MSTFQTWLNDQTAREMTDPVGWLARLWDSHKEHRPRLSSPDRIGAWLIEQTADEPTQRGITQALGNAKTAYANLDTSAPAGRTLTAGEQQAFTEMNEPAPDGSTEPPDAPAPAGPPGETLPVLPARQEGAQDPYRLTGDSGADLARIADHLGLPPYQPASLDQLTAMLTEATNTLARRLDGLERLAAIELRYTERIARRLGIEPEPLDTAMTLASQLAEPPPVPVAPAVNGDMGSELYGGAIVPDHTPQDRQRADFGQWWGMLNPQS
jgi:hypothetical protein